MQQTSHAQSHRGTVRKVNEDAYLELPCHGIWVVADGMGGHAAGDVASQLIIDKVQRVVERTSPEDMSDDILVEALQDANQQLLRMSETEFSGQCVGSTVVILFIKNNSSHLLWAGDSRAYLLRNQQLSQVTKDHSQVNEMVDEGLLKPEDAETHPLANVITRAVGVAEYLDIEIKMYDLQHDDVFLLCSDGLNKEVSDTEIEQALCSGSIIDSGMALMHASLVRNARDNVTCILVKHQGLKHIPSIDNDDTTIPLFRSLC
jgi:serine/threonine protein phosphatase PrpC